MLGLDLVSKTIQEEVAFLCREWDTELSDECCQSGFRGDSANLPRQHMEQRLVLGEAAAFATALGLSLLHEILSNGSKDSIPLIGMGRESRKQTHSLIECKYE